jgi:hypothetical protein
MKTDDLIATLAADTTPAPRIGPMAWLGLACAAALVLAVALLAAWLGVRPDLMLAMRLKSFWMKAGYTGWLAVAAFVAVTRLARPGARLGAALWLAILGVLAMTMMGGVRLMAAPPAERMHDWMGHSWTFCPFLIMGVSAPAFAVIVWAVRRYAPTKLRLTGAGAGLLAGAIGAAVYGLLRCNETTAAFVATWYTLGIAVCAAVGAVLGPRLLRW